MNIELLNKQLYWEFANLVDAYKHGEEIDFTEMKYKVDQLLQSAESCKAMIENRKKIKNQEFYDMLNEFAFITEWNDYDCYRVIELAYNKKFEGSILKTTMHRMSNMDDSNKKNNEYCDQVVGVNYKVLCDKDYRIKYEHMFTKEDVQNLIDYNLIVILKEEERRLSHSKPDYKPEKYQEFECAYDKYSMQYEFFHENGKFYPYTLRYIRKQATNKKLKELFKEHLKHINYEIDDITNKQEWNDSPSCDYITEECAKKFEEAGFTKRLVKLNENNK